MRIWKIILLFSVLLPCGTTAQTRALDVLKQELASCTDDAGRLRVYLDMCSRHHSINTDTLYGYVTTAGRLANQEGLWSIKPKVEYYRSVYLMKKMQIDSGLALCNQWIALVKNDADPGNYKRFLQGRCELLGRKRKIKEALETAYTLLHLAESTGDIPTTITARYLIATQFGALFEWEKMLNWLTACEQTGGAERFMEEKNSEGLYMKYGQLYDEGAHSFDTSDLYLRKAVAISRQTEDYKMLGLSLMWQASLYLRHHRVQQAMPIMQEANKWMDFVDDRGYDHAKFLLQYDYYQMTGQADKAIAYCKAEIEKTKRSNNQVNLIQKYWCLRGTYGELKDYKNASIYQDTLFGLTQRAHEQNQGEAFAEYEAAYKLKDKEYELVRNKLKIAEEQNKRNLLLALLVLGTGAMIAVFRGLKKRYNNKLQLARQEEEAKKELAVQETKDKERTRISRELHDNIGAQLSYIRSNVNFLVDAPPNINNEERLQLLNKINHTAQNSISDLRESIWVLHKDNISFQDLADKLKAHISHRLEEYGNTALEVEEKITASWSLPAMDALHVLRIFQEALSNSIKYAGAGKIRLEIYSPRAQAFKITLKDNGTGFDTGKAEDEHYGLDNMRKRAAECGLSLSITSEPGNGTEIIAEKSA